MECSGTQGAGGHAAAIRRKLAWSEADRAAAGLTKSDSRLPCRRLLPPPAAAASLPLCTAEAQMQLVMQVCVARSPVLIQPLQQNTNPTAGRLSGWPSGEGVDRVSCARALPATSRVPGIGILFCRPAGRIIMLLCSPPRPCAAGAQHSNRLAGAAACSSNTAHLPTQLPSYPHHSTRRMQVDPSRQVNCLTLSATPLSWQSLWLE